MYPYFFMYLEWKTLQKKGMFVLSPLQQFWFFVQVLHLSCLSSLLSVTEVLKKDMDIDIEHVSRTKTVPLLYQISYDILHTYIIYCYIYIYIFLYRYQCLYSILLSHIPTSIYFLPHETLRFSSTSPTTSLKAECLPEVTSEIEDQGAHWGCAQ